MQTLINFFSLGFVRAADAVYLLVLTPLLIRRLGIDQFGVIVLVQTVLNYGRAIVDYGFNISGVRELAIVRETGRQPGELLSEALFTRALTGITLMLLLSVLVRAVPCFHPYAPFFYWGLPFLLAHILFVDWYFIGIQRSAPLALANLLGKASAALFVIALIRKPQDGHYFLALTGFGSLLGNGGLWVFLYYRHPFSFSWPGFPSMVRRLRDDFRLVLSNLAIELNSSFPIIALNILMNNAVTGYFSLLQKLIQPLRFLLVIFSQLLFPRACDRLNQGIPETWKFLKRSTLAFAIVPLTGCIVLFPAAVPVLDFFTGTAPAALAGDFRLYLLLPMIILFNIPAYQLLLACEQRKIYSRIYLAGLGLNVLLCLILPGLMGMRGAIVAVLWVEGFITLGLHLAAAKLRREASA